MFEYLASVQSAVRRINDRISTLSARFGENSAIVNDIVAKIDVMLPDNIRYKDGVLQITRPSDIFGDDEKEQLIADLDKNIKTWGQYKQAYEKEYTAYRQEASENGYSDKLSMEQFIATMNNIDKALKDVPSDAMPTEALNIMKQKGRKKTYSELFRVYQILEDKGFA